MQDVYNVLMKCRNSQTYNNNSRVNKWFIPVKYEIDDDDLQLCSPGWTLASLTTALHR
jgi:hypothetical protein